MKSATARKCLVLNPDMQPLSTCPLSLLTAQEAIRAVVKDSAEVLDEWPEVMRSPSITMHVPKVVMLREYAPIWAAPKFCRRNVLLRDHYRCQYCGEQFPPHELTFDHVRPRSQGGQTVWENILMACVPCNEIKRDSLPNYSGRRGVRDFGNMRPLKEPRQPSAAELRMAGLKFLEPHVMADFGSWLYWNAELSA